MVKRFKLNEMEYHKNDKTKYFIYDLIENKELFNLKII